MAEPPVAVGAVQLRSSLASPAVALRPVGAPGGHVLPMLRGTFWLADHERPVFVHPVEVLSLEKLDAENASLVDPLQKFSPFRTLLAAALK